MTPELESVVYEQKRKLIQSLVRKFAQRHGGDVEELISEANLIFVNVCRSYVPEKGTFDNRLVFMTWKRLMDVRKAERRRRLPVAYKDMDTIPAQHRESTLESVIRQCSHDARTIIRIVLQSPPDLFDRGRGAKVILNMVLQDMGWGLRRIKQCYKEIARVLRSES